MPDPLLSELVKRAGQEVPLDDPQPTSTKSSAMWPMLAALGGGAADVITTQRGLAKGGREVNPLLPQNRLANGLMLGGSYLGSALLSKLLNDHGHPTAAKALGYGAGADGALFGILNTINSPK